MVAEQETQLTFAGTKKDKQVAEQAMQLMRGQGRFMATNAPIRVSLTSLAKYFTDQAEASAAAVEKAIVANPEIFAIEERDGERLVVTTIRGHIPIEQHESTVHTFSARLMTPLPKPERPAVAPRERPLVAPSWTTFTEPADLYETLIEEEEALAEPAAVVESPAELVEEPISVEAPEVVPTILEQPEEAPAAELVAEEPAVEAEAATAPELATDVDALVEPEVALSDQDERQLITLDAEDEVVAPEAEVTQVEEPVVTPVPNVVAAPRPAPVLVLSDVSDVADADLAAAIDARLREDTRVAHFGDHWLSEDRVPRLSRGDLRRIKDYIDEQEQPLTDTTLAQDILGVRPNAPDFDLARFAVNVRLSREHREFDFVGTNGQRFWSTSALPQLGTTRRRPNDIGTDFRFLLEESDPSLEPHSVRSVDRVLTFYEYTLGLLPLDADMRRLLPKALLPDQRSAVLTFECPQSYTTYLVEVRYPTPNRGGFLLGLDDFFSENLVPGALISITATENDGHYRLEYLAGENQSARLLELDDRRAVRYVFRPTSYACTVASEMLISEERFPSLGSEKPLDDRLRRRPEAVVQATFERIGIDTDEGKLAAFDDLYAAANIERPYSRELLRTTLESDTHITTADDGETYTYAAGA
ncbi:MAG: hypothetical protein H0W06_10725 [Chloroflexia bacterium]|nr:hypothetical protein [Chloroflexia bacterium]